MEILIACCEAELDAKDHHGRTALLYAAGPGMIAMVQLNQELFHMLKYISGLTPRLYFGGEGHSDYSSAFRGTRYY